MPARIGLIIAIILASFVTIAGIIVPNQKYFSGEDDDVLNRLDDPFGPVFPRLNRASVLYVVKVTDLSYEEKLVAVSLQGLVNKNSSALYLEYGRTEWLMYLNETYDQSIDYISLDYALIKFREFVKGIVIYNPSIPATVNVATTLSALENYLIASPELATWVSSLTNSNVTMDLREGYWSSYGESQTIYKRVIDELYPSLRQDVFGMLNPDKTYLRDYLIAIGAMCVDINPGPVLLPEDDSVVQAILDLTPVHTTILGWFKDASGLEENYGVKRLSENGKVLLPADYVPNLSVFAAYEFKEKPFPRDRDTEKNIPELENKIYLTFVFSDGDNLAVHHNNYMYMWNLPDRGTVPIGWSVSPVSVEIAPPLYEYFYSKMSENDTLVCGTSGAGVFYPDFFLKDELGPLAARTGELMDRGGLDTIWLVNSYTAHETTYSKRVQRAYADYIQPEGVFLDYADVPISREYWISRGEYNHGIPFIRATHFWESPDNFLAKVNVVKDTVKTRPTFIFAATHIWTVDLEEVVSVINVLNATNPESEYKVVSPDEFFRLMKVAEVARANDNFKELDDWPYYLMDNEKTEIEEELKSAEKAITNGDLDTAAYRASNVNEEIKDIKTDVLTIFIVLFIILLASFFGILFRRIKKHRAQVAVESEIDKLLSKVTGGDRVSYYTELVMLFAAGTGVMLAFFEVLFAFFWDWPALIITIGLAFTFVPVANSRKYNNISSRYKLILGSSLIFVFGPATFLMKYFIPLALMGFIMILESSPAVRICGPKILIVPMVLAIMVTGLTRTNFYMMFVFGFWALALSLTVKFKGYKLPKLPEKKPSDAPSLPTLFMVLALMTFYIPSSRYLSLKTGDLNTYLWNLHLIIPIGALFVAFPLVDLIGQIRVKEVSRFPEGALIRGSLIGTTAIAFFIIFFNSDPFIMSTMILAAQVCLLALVLTTTPVKWYNTYPPYFARDFVLFFIIVNFIFILPVLAYTLYITEIGFSLNYILYAFPLSFAIGLIIFSIPVTFYWRLKE